MHILISGASSSIGQYVCKRLAEDYPDATLTGLYHRHAPSFQAPNLSYIAADFLQDTADAVPIALLKEIDIFLHLASVTPGNNPDGNSDHFFVANAHTPAMLVKTMLMSGRLRKIFHLSSTAVYDRTRGLTLDETSPKSHKDPYGLSKLMFENALYTLHAHFAFYALSLRLPVLLTPGVTNNFMSKWKKAMAAGETLSVAHPAAAFNAVCPDWALYEACTLFLTSGGTGCKIANIAASKATSLKDILHARGYPNWKEAESAMPPQLIVTLHQGHRLYPAYEALTEAVKFLS